MNAKQAKRLAKERGAGEFAEAHHDPLVNLFNKVSFDLAAELDGVPQIQADARLAAEMANRLDRQIAIPNELAESLDWFAYFLGSLIVIGVVRSLERISKRRKERVTTLKRRLKDRGPRLTSLARRNLERRIARLESK